MNSIISFQILNIEGFCRFETADYRFWIIHDAER